MSTAIALQDMGTSSIHHTGTIRRRIDSTTDSDKVQETDAWLDQPHDSTSSALPLDSRSFVPTAVYWISPHGLMSKKLTVLDLTKDMTVPYTGLTKEYKAEVKKTLKKHSFTPVTTCHRNHWAGLQYTITDAQDEQIGHWSHPWISTREAVLTFPDGSPHSSHPIRMKNKRWGLRTESFTLNSQPFLWEMDSLFHSVNMTLYKVTGTGDACKKVEVAKYAQKWWGSFVTGGTLVVNEEEIDGVVACLTLLVVLKKKRQRAAERNSGGGGGGGGS